MKHMIYTLTLSPAIDVYIELDTLEEGKINRTSRERFVVGGKGINVSLALQALGVESIPITVLGGFTGKYIEDNLKKLFNPILFYTEEPTRMNIKILEEQKETAINIIQPLPKHISLEIKRILSALMPEDILVVCGSGSYQDYAFLLENLVCKIILDVDGNHLRKLLSISPWIVKPNDEELMAIAPSVEEAYSILLEKAEVILHTKGSLGVTLRKKDFEYSLLPQKTDIITSVGCGDAFLAGFLASTLEKQTLENSLAFAMKCGYYRGKKQSFLIRKK